MNATSKTTTSPGGAEDRGTMASLVDAASRQGGTAIKHPHGDGWRELSYRELGATVRETLLLAASLRSTQHSTATAPDHSCPPDP